MLFNSIDFAIFLPIIFIIYWLFGNKSKQAQNFILLIASYLFYSFWDYRFLFLIILSSTIDYLVGIKISNSSKKNEKKNWLILSVSTNIGLLLFFKYYNFFIDNFINTFTLLGGKFEYSNLYIILPVGISFYTFQTISYSVDIYRNKIKPTKNIISFFTYVSFFPQLVAGPIERATTLLPQFYKKRYFNYIESVNGLKQILWGLFKKIVIADNCALVVNDIFLNYSQYSGTTLVLGAIFFAFQIYCDFSGYSDIAIGTAKLFGLNLMQNFSFPYFSRDIGEFWRRWHISLTTWFKDYIYIPLGGSRVSKIKIIRNVIIIFVLSGFWHGANWTFIIWGLINVIYFLPLILSNHNRKHIKIIQSTSFLPSFSDLIKIILTFSLVTFSWIFFRAENTNHAFSYIYHMFTNLYFESPNISVPNINILKFSILIIFLLMIEWLGKEGNYALEKFSSKWNKIIKWCFYYFILFLIFIYSKNKQEFIYFQF